VTCSVGGKLWVVALLALAALAGCGGGGGGGGSVVPTTSPSSTTATPTPGPHFTQFPIPATWSSFSSPGSVAPGDIAPGPDGALWFTEGNAAAIGRITTSGLLSQFPVANSGGTYSITAGPDGAMWFTDSKGFVGRMDTSGNVTNEYNLGAQHTEGGITVGPDGNLWFVDASATATSVGKISTTGVFALYPLPSGGQFLTSGPDGALWVTEFQTGKVARVPVSGMGITEYSLPAGAGPIGITVGADKNFWIADGLGAIYRMTTSGSYTTFGDSDTSFVRSPWGITSNPDGNLYYTESYAPFPGTADGIVRMTTSGVATAFILPGVLIPKGVTTGPDGNIWFAENNANRIGELILR
jgi:virginiamycin B lyase